MGDDFFEFNSTFPKISSIDLGSINSKEILKNCTLESISDIINYLEKITKDDNVDPLLNILLYIRNQDLQSFYMPSLIKKYTFESGNFHYNEETDTLEINVTPVKSEEASEFITA